MTDTEFKVGDNVQLKSGGPVMNIQHIGGGIATCTWFDQKQTHN